MDGSIKMIYEPINNIDFNKVIKESFDSTTKQLFRSYNIEVNIDDLTTFKYPNPLNYIQPNYSHMSKNPKENNVARNHPRIREIEGLVKYDVTLKDLDVGSYNYCFFKDTYTDKYHVCFGKVTSCIELGVKHSIISKGFPIILSGEILKEFINGIYVYKYNFNSSNFNIYNLKNIILKQNKKIYDDYYLNINKNNIHKFSTENKISISVIEKKICEFYLQFIVPFSNQLLSSISREENDKHELEYTVAIQEIYLLNKNKKYYDGLHYCYNNNVLYSEEFIKKVNLKGNPRIQKRKDLSKEYDKEDHYNKIISGMCIIKDYAGRTKDFKCTQDDKTNLVDMLEDLFIQLFYQVKMTEKNNNEPIYIFDDENKSIRKNIFMALKKLYPNLENYDKNQILSYSSMWFCRYLNKNFSNFTLETYFCKPGKNFQKTSFRNIKDENIKKNLESELNVVKLYFYALLRLNFDVNINNVTIYQNNEGNSTIRKFKFLINGKSFYLKFSNKYRIILKIDTMFYSEGNHILDANNRSQNISFFEEYKYTSDNDNDNNNDKDNNDLNDYLNLTQCLEDIPLPIKYVTLNNKYIKKKIDNDNLSNRLNKLETKYKKYKNKYLASKNGTNI